MVGGPRFDIMELFGNYLIIVIRIIIGGNTFSNRYITLLNDYTTPRRQELV